MRKTLLILLAICWFGPSFAQTTHPCAAEKLNALSRPAKKSRAGALDNLLMQQYDVHFYFLDLNVERNSTVISGSATIGARITSSTIDTFCFELNPNLIIDSIQYLNQNITFSRTGAITYAKFNSPVAVNTNTFLKIFYRGNASVTGAGAIGDGFTTGTSPSWGNLVTWSLSEPYSAYEWFPCKQFLTDKADSAWVFITTDQANRAGSNGLLEGVDSLPGNKKRYRWKTHYTIDYYLISVAVAKYVDYTIYAHPSALAGDSIPVVNYVYDNPATLPNFKSRIDSIPLMLNFFSDLLGLYPFYEEKYGHCMAPLGGGMEHQTMTTIGNLGNFSINAHELVHQWFGNHVTCKTWKDIFINEGFATYGEYLAFEHLRGYAAAQNDMAQVHDDVLTDPTASVYFTDTTNVGRIFSSRETYNKGSAVIHTLRFILGDSLFFKGLREFQTNFSFGNASIDDLKLSMETSTGTILSDYFNDWIYGEGYPTYSAEYTSNGSTIFLKISQTGSSSATPLFKTPLEIKCSSTSGDTTVRVTLDQNTNSFIIPSTKSITGLSIDPNNWLLNKTGTITKNPDLVLLSASDLALQQQFLVYPNPFNTQITLQNSTGLKTDVLLREINGRVIYQGELSDKSSIDLSHLHQGIYMLELISSKGKVVKKIIKN